MMSYWLMYLYYGINEHDIRCVSFSFSKINCKAKMFSKKNYGVHQGEPVSLDLDMHVTFFIPTCKTYGYSFQAVRFSINFLSLLNSFIKFATRFNH